MTRRPVKKSIKEKTENSYKKCDYCRTHRDARGFDKHRAACKIRFTIQNESRTARAARAGVDGNATNCSAGHNTQAAPTSLLEPIDEQTPDPALLDLADDSNTPSSSSNPTSVPPSSVVADEYIKITPHPHSLDPTTIIVPLNSPKTAQPERKPGLISAIAGDHEIPVDSRPWAPFRSLADFEYTETAVNGLLSKQVVNKQLEGFNSAWAIGSRLTIRNSNDMEASLAMACEYIIKFKSASVSVEYQGRTHKFDFQYRDPWEWILALIHDESLAPLCMWNSVKKFHCTREKGERIIDEPNTGDAWWNIDSSLPDSKGGFPHCHIPLHFWLDKGMVTRRVKKFPMVLRPAWLPRQVRNASGNGGGLLLGYMPIIEDPSDPSARSAAETLQFAQFKREVYQKVLKQVFRTLKRRSWYGEAHRCADGEYRILYPGILIESQDGEEASYFCACRAALANYPCPKCLVCKDELHCVSRTFPARTSESMRAVIEQVSVATTKAKKEKILQDHGLHDIKHFLWDFRFSDPYKALSYDTLHSDDLGKWGKHIWELLLGVLENAGAKGVLTERMSAFPRWNGLKHFHNVTTIKFTDGQSFYDILKASYCYLIGEWLRQLNITIDIVYPPLCC
ncbi:hypothetical protein HYPSUDRAFT_73169 [Hypholoma sublateritium FD-334 SS-4]|uniref:Uncharacterized protein n=1 Tax=Hypholoma sublateritium (strain FD-334 SS-4) TaxID=945553 RepID=A0A0D2LQ63_HYPSF|nr:hypothetical protein HYPSUDRAFT_73169 [Hypholoma sublateritium FD-334 SS-4]